jgi:glyoxylase-like metal-dependent hydrolase (beta-lactamase superfamily II)
MKIFSRSSTINTEIGTEAEKARAMLSRRGFCLCCIASGAFAASGWLTPREVFAKAQGIVDMIKSDAATAPIEVTKLRGNVAVLMGSGGNVAVLNGPDGKVLIDAGIGVSKAHIGKALDGLGKEPITTLINTHWHFDHADGNDWLHSAGATIYGHENTRKHLSEAQRVDDWDYNFPAAPAGGVPTQILGDATEMKLNGQTLRIKYYGPAHTDGDLSVYFAEADILHTGDTLWNGIYPFIDYSTGGSIDGSIKAAQANVDATTDKTIVIPGHGPIATRADLVAFRDMLVTIRKNVADLKSNGHSLDETVAAKPTAVFDDKWGKFVIDPAFFTRLIYHGV